MRGRNLLPSWFGLIPLLTASLGAQTLNNGSLSGQYHFVQLLVNASGGALTDVRNLIGDITFDGKGGYTYTGRCGVQSGALEPQSGQSSYYVRSDGFTGMPSPIDTNVQQEGGLSADLKVVIGASTGYVTDRKSILFAVKAPAGTVSASLLNGKYTAVLLQFPNASAAGVRSGLATMTADGAGRFQNASGRGHAADQSGRNQSVTVEQATYSLLADGSGTAFFPAGTGGLFAGTWEILTSGDGDFFLGVSSVAGIRDILVATRHYSAAAKPSDFEGTHWIAEMAVDTGSYSVATGRVVALAGGRAMIAERLGQDRTVLDFSGLNSYRVDPESTGALAPVHEDGLLNMALGGTGASAPTAMVGAQIGSLETTTSSYGLFLGARAPAPTGTGVFVYPSGVVNAASFAPMPHPVSPGAIVALFGTNLASESVSATTIPLPTSLGGISVTIGGKPAPLFAVGSNQINFQVPFEIAGMTSANLTVTKGTSSSNSVTVSLAPTSPGIFQWNDGETPNRAVITHANYSLVTCDNPARRGETIQIWVNGLGVLDPPVLTGAGNPIAEPLARAVDKNIMVYFGGEPAEQIDYAGGTPYLVGLNQINAKVPLSAPVGSNVPLAIGTSTAYSDLVDVAIGN